MKTWLFCLGIILMSSHLLGQTPTTITLNLVPTDSLGLFLSGYDVMGTVFVEPIDTTTLAAVEVRLGTTSGDNSLFHSTVTMRAGTEFFSNGVTVKRVSEKLWVTVGAISYSPAIYYQIILYDLQGGVLLDQSSSTLIGQ